MIYKYMYKTPEGFSNMIMNSDGENLTPYKQLVVRSDGIQFVL